MFLIGWFIGFIIGLSFFFVKKVKVYKINNDLFLEEKRLKSKIENQKADFLAKQQLYEEEIVKLENDWRIFSEELLKRKTEHEQNLNTQLEQLTLQYQDNVTMFCEESKKTIAQCQKEIQENEKLLESLKHKVDAATEVAKREEEKRTAVDFYRLQLSAADCEEVKKLREIVSTLRDQDAINKVIWKVYYEKPTTDLIGRVIGSKIKTGIYKITNIQNQMTYVGQSVNIAERWKQHIKRGLGAEAPTRNKLYPAMAATGLENFTFELIEECDKSLLDEREKYWQNYFNSLTYGYSMR